MEIGSILLAAASALIGAVSGALVEMVLKRRNKALAEHPRSQLRIKTAAGRIFSIQASELTREKVGEILSASGARAAAHY